MAQDQALYWYEIAQRLKYLGYPAWDGVDEQSTNTVAGIRHIGLSVGGVDFPINSPEHFFANNLPANFIQNNVPANLGYVSTSNTGYGRVGSPSPQLVTLVPKVSPYDSLVVEALKLFEASVYPVTKNAYVSTPYSAGTTSLPYVVSSNSPDSNALLWLESGSPDSPRWLDFNAALNALPSTPKVPFTVAEQSTATKLGLHIQQLERFGTSWAFNSLLQIASSI